jgi:hypothetical protein
MRIYLALFVAGNIIGRDGMVFWIGIAWKEEGTTAQEGTGIPRDGRKGRKFFMLPSSCTTLA